MSETQLAAIRTEDFDYDLPSGAIAQAPVEPRDSCRLLVLDRVTGEIDHLRFTDLPDLLHPDDLVVVNETRVIPARLKGEKAETGGAVEVLLLRERYDDTWECLVKPGRRLGPGSHVVFGGGELTGFVVDTVQETGGRLIKFTSAQGTFLDAVHHLGEMPLPPYITRPLDDPSLYQTVYAKDERSAAAPTAGLHFTPTLLEHIRSRGVGVANVELDVGLDTFRPVAEDVPTDHRMHQEHFRVPEGAAEQVAEARARGGRIVAVGTTSVRALESAVDSESGEVKARESTSSLFILPGYEFSAVDAMITNFHMPRSTLLMMVSAFAGQEAVRRAYSVALEEGYRFLSFGDAMLIV